MNHELRDLHIEAQMRRLANVPLLHHQRHHRYPPFTHAHFLPLSLSLLVLFPHHVIFRLSCTWSVFLFGFFLYRSIILNTIVILVILSCAEGNEMSVVNHAGNFYLLYYVLSLRVVCRLRLSIKANDKTRLQS